MKAKLITTKITDFDLQDQHYCGKDRVLLLKAVCEDDFPSFVLDVNNYVLNNHFKTKHVYGFVKQFRYSKVISYDEAKARELNFDELEPHQRGLFLHNTTETVIIDENLNDYFDILSAARESKKMYELRENNLQITNENYLYNKKISEFEAKHSSFWQRLKFLFKPQKVIDNLF